MRHVHVVAALIRDPADDARFLVQQRPPNKSRALLWEFPGGKVEQGESDEAALIRECREELDVEVTVGRKVWETQHEYPDLLVTLALYEARIDRGTPKPLDSNALRFETPVGMQKLPFCEADLPLLELLVKDGLGLNVRSV